MTRTTPRTLTRTTRKTMKSPTRRVLTMTNPMRTMRKPSATWATMTILKRKKRVTMKTTISENDFLNATLALIRGDVLVARELFRKDGAAMGRQVSVVTTKLYEAMERLQAKTASDLRSEEHTSELQSLRHL